LRRTAQGSRSEIAGTSHSLSARTSLRARGEFPRRVPKLLGGDCELGNFIVGTSTSTGTGALAARLLLDQIDGIESAQGRAVQAASYAAFDPQDHGRKFLASTGGCFYIDLDHLEFCVPETLSARDFVAASRACLLLALAAKRRADRELPDGKAIEVVANNTDNQSTSWGSHLNVLISREAWADLFERRLHYAQWLASFQVSSVILTGAGKVGANNGQPSTTFQISARADFFETLCGIQTTYRRPILNSRDEPLAGIPRADCPSDELDPARDYARFHCIFYDHTLCERASLLRAGCLQIALAMIEAERVDCTWLLDDPVRALHSYSRDPHLNTRARLVSGAEANALDLQRRYFDDAMTAYEAGELGSVPHAYEILTLWDDTLTKLSARDFEALFGRLDWPTKWLHLDAIRRARGFDWSSPQLLQLDQLYANLDPGRGLFWSLARNQGVERWIADDEIFRFLREPPSDTRAFARAQIRRAVDPAAVARVAWDRVELCLPGPAHVQRAVAIFLENPLDPKPSVLEGEGSRAWADALPHNTGP
jgi:proteasome accessory factor A